ncbi:hypothetical protein OUY22_27015 [Nonomuraea sp. MCN248]|uniref:Uncharacterized protein n=1 Tax=Nonomuraea corallina TaxID=2989783 RepID=A0ABT4SJF2_9ACTN|nr:hypothetical protein [Nonomuraea corallina]MDA0637070.1 hypothetical protein [Nonomuraea corallina]
MSDLVPTGDLTPIDGGYVPNNPYEYADGYKSIPSYLEAVPEYGPTDGIRDTIDRYWSYVIRWPRYAALCFLLMTYSFWRSAFVLGTAALLIVALVSK